MINKEAIIDCLVNNSDKMSQSELAEYMGELGVEQVRARRIAENFIKKFGLQPLPDSGELEAMIDRILSEEILWQVNYLLVNEDSWRSEKGFVSREQAQKWAAAENLADRADEIEIEPQRTN